MRLKINPQTVLLLASFVLFIVFSFWRYSLGQVRYFDIDEFIYPNWAYHISVGYRPYLDFMFFVPPVYPLILIPLFKFGHGVDPLIFARTVAFVVTLILAVATMLLFWELRRSWLAIAAGLVLIALPVPSDKLLEIRPDILSFAFFVFGLTSQMKWMKKGSKRWIFLTGVFYGLALLTSQKVLPYVFIALILALAKSIKISGKITIFLNIILLLIFGLSIVTGPFIVWVLLSGNPDIVLYSLVKLPFEQSIININRIPPFFYFRPNNIYFGEWGVSSGFILNSVLWTLGIVIGVIRVVYAFVFFRKDVFRELILGILCISAVLIYIVNPTKFPQYAIPSAVFVAWNIADALHLLWIKTNYLKWKRYTFFIIYSIGLLVLYKTFLLVHLPKLNWTNKEQLAYISNIHATVPETEYILDMIGQTLYYPYPHYVCCLPYAEFRKYLSISLPSIKQSLIQTKTKYITGNPLRIMYFASDDLDFIQDNYIKKDDLFYMAKPDAGFLL